MIAQMQEVRRDYRKTLDFDESLREEFVAVATNCEVRSGEFKNQNIVKDNDATFSRTKFNPNGRTSLTFGFARIGVPPKNLWSRPMFVAPEYLGFEPVGDNTDFQSGIARLSRLKRIRHGSIHVHGYNTSVAEATSSAAILANVNSLSYIPIVFVWPSHHLPDYHAAREKLESSISAATSLIDQLSRADLVTVHASAHSLGSELLGRLMQIASLTRNNRSANISIMKKLQMVTFFAPDISANNFQDWVEPFILANPQVSLRIYASAHDRVLAFWSSSAQSRFTRIGSLSRFEPVERNGSFVHVDQSAISNNFIPSALQTTGHGYYLHTTVLRDFGEYCTQATGSTSQSIRGAKQLFIR